MNRQLAFALALSALGTLAHGAGAQNGANTAPEAPACLKYQPESVQLVGHLERLTFPGGPNFKSVSGGDTPEDAFYLRLAHPVCTMPDGTNQAKTDVTLLQLIADTAKLRFMADKEVVVHGTLLPASSGHHHTPVILMPAMPLTLYKAP
ncbi:MAG TPA: DUF4431 domain-containing protein [Gemmatimonadaceae bacterium]|jgi:hypothetical protein